MGAFLRKYATGTGADVAIPIIKAGVNDYAAGGDWTPAAGDVKVSKDGGSQANIATLPTYSNGDWVFVFSNSELTCKRLSVRIVDSATKAIEDDGFNVETHGHASAMIVADLTDAVRLGLTAMPNAAAGASGGLPTGDASGRVDVSKIAGSAVSTSSAQIGVNVVTYASGQAPLQPTTAGRTLDVTTTGEAGIDLANVGSPTTTLALTNTTIGTATTIGSTGLTAIASAVWSYLSATAAALTSTMMGYYVYTKLGYITSATTLSTVTVSDGSDLTLYKGSGGSLTLAVPYSGAGTPNFTGRTLRLVWRTVGGACTAAQTITGSVTGAGTTGQSVTFTWTGTSTSGLTLSTIRGEGTAGTPRYDYAYRWTVSSIDGGTHSDSIIVACGGVKVLCDDGASA